MTCTLDDGTEHVAYLTRGDDSIEIIPSLAQSHQLLAEMGVPAL